MKTAFLRFPLLAALAGSCCAVSGTAKVATPPTSPRPVIYMGADLSVQQGKNFYQVEDVDGSEFVISVGGKNKFVRTRMQSNNVKVKKELKFSPLSVQLDDMQGVAGYTPAADPRHKFNARSGAASGAKAASELAAYRSGEIQSALSALGNNPNGADPVRQAQLQSSLETEQANQNLADYQLGSDYSSIPSMANDLAKELDEGNFDMVDVSFRISSPEPLDDPYMVVLVEFQPRGAKPGESSLLIHAKALDPIDAKPKYIRVREGGMPVGFKFLRHEVHIYNRGREVATNASSKRVELTREEARLYLVIEHIGANKGATQVAEAVRGSLSPAIRSRLRPDQLENVSYVRVSKDGVPLGVYVDESASLPVSDEDLVAAVKDAFFKPALHDGKPVDGVVRVRLGELTL